MDSFAKETLPISLEEEMRRSYLDYAMSVIVGRALPDVRDGLKPVHRRVLFVEEDAAWLNLAQEFPAWLPDGSGFFWMTEKNGAAEVELRNADGTFGGTWVKAPARYGAAARPVF